MSILEVIGALLLLVVVLWGAKQVPAPFNFVLYALAVLIIVLLALSLTHASALLGRRV